MRPIDANTLKAEFTGNFNGGYYTVPEILAIIDTAPTIGGWISVKDRLPDEHDSLFANNPYLKKNMWAKESDSVIVYVRFPDGTGRSTEGKLQDGKWWTRISPALEPTVTHWMPLPEPPKEDDDGTD